MEKKTAKCEPLLPKLATNYRSYRARIILTLPTTVFCKFELRGNAKFLHV